MRCIDEMCVICGVLGCVPLKHDGQVLRRSEAVRFSRAIIADGADSPRAKILAKYILDSTETP